MAESAAEIVRQITVHNEQTKFRATLLNTVAAGFIVAGVITPIVNVARDTTQPAGSTLLLMVVRFLLALALFCGVLDLGAAEMTDAVWLSATAAALVTVALTATSMLLSRRSAARIDHLVAEREAADRQHKKAADDADQLLKDNLIRTQR